MQFNTVAGPSDSLLTTAPIATFGFLGSHPAAIAVQGATLIDGEGLQQENFIGGLVSSNLHNFDTRPAAGIDIKTRELTLTNESRISTYTNGNIRSGDIVIRTDTLNVTHGAVIETATFGSGDAGTVDIAANRVALSGPMPLKLIAFPTPTGEFQFLEVATT
jgi:hypothetical protein